MRFFFVFFSRLRNFHFFALSWWRGVHVCGPCKFGAFTFFSQIHTFKQTNQRTHSVSYSNLLYHNNEVICFAHGKDKATSKMVHMDTIVLMIFRVNCVRVVFGLAAVCLFTMNLFLNITWALALFPSVSFRMPFSLLVFLSLSMVTTHSQRTHSFHQMDSINSGDTNSIRHLHKILLINNRFSRISFDLAFFQRNPKWRNSLFICTVLGSESLSSLLLSRSCLELAADDDMKLWKMIRFSFDHGDRGPTETFNYSPHTDSNCAAHRRARIRNTKTS